MACEKVAKAHYFGTGRPPDDVRTSHAHTANAIPVIFQNVMSREEKQRHRHLARFQRHCRRLARAIEVLHPSVDDDGRCPENCEYPWEDGPSRLLVPAEYTFTTVQQLLSDNDTILFLKLILRAIEVLVRG